MKKNKLIVVFIFAILLIISFSFGREFQRQIQPICQVFNKNLGKPETFDFSSFWEAWDKIEKNFVDKEKINYEEMMYGAIRGMTSALQDPYTVFLDPSQTKIFDEDIEGKFEGIGAEIGIRNKILTIIAPLEGTPAQKAGLKAGDKILKINNKLTDDISLYEAVKLIRGKKGTKVVLTIIRESFKEPKDFEIIRDEIKIPVLKYELKDKDIAYIKIYQFSKNLNKEFSNVAKDILTKNVKKIILDLRNNPGGLLMEAKNLAGWFLEKGDIVAIESFGNKQTKFLADGPSVFSKTPIVILINKGSASASEILAGALRDNRKIKLIGETSYGKGSVQEEKYLKKGGSLKITIARWLTPKGKLIEGKGLKPDIEIKLNEEDIKNERDPQLEKALEVIKNL